MIPQWLPRFKNPDYLSAVLEILGKRETNREIIRSHARGRAATHSNSLRKRTIPSLPGEVSEQALLDHYDISAGCHPTNVTQNRYIQLEPYNRTRVVIGNDPTQELYMNANWVQELYGHKWWIATQAPVPESMHTFLSLILQKSVRPPGSGDTPSNVSTRIRTVVQLTLDIEGGRRKAQSYFPSQVGGSWQINPEGYADSNTSPAPIITTLVEQSTIQDAHCLCSTVSVISGGDDPSNAVTFQHLLYQSWPDHGVPAEENLTALLTFLKLVDQKNREIPHDQPTSPTTGNPDPDPPIIINCSAGIGRTGSFIALSSLLRTYNFIPTSPQPQKTITTSSLLPYSSPLGPLPQQFMDDEVCLEIDSLREQRPGMVQRDEQIVLIYKILSNAFESLKQKD